MDLPKRKSIRLKDYDYSSNGAYFITVCTKDKKNLFGCIVAKVVGADNIRPNEIEYKTHLSEMGKTVKTAIESISIHYSYVSIEKYVIMPNHIHLLILIKGIDSDGRIISAPTDSKKRLEIVIGQMKRWVSKQIGFSVWQKSFYDHIIRTENDYLDAWSYIDSNPRLWLEGKDNH